MNEPQREDHRSVACSGPDLATSCALGIFGSLTTAALWFILCGRDELFPELDLLIYPGTELDVFCGAPVLVNAVVYAAIVHALRLVVRL